MAVSRVSALETYTGERHDERKLSITKLVQPVRKCPAVIEPERQSQSSQDRIIGPHCEFVPLHILIIFFSGVHFSSGPVLTSVYRRE